MISIKNSYRNKRFSVYGDSISTLFGYSRPAEAVYYDFEKSFSTKIYEKEHTWWGKVISELGGTLLVNNSFSGCTVCRHPLCEIPSYGCSDRRIAMLHTSWADPDVIMVFMGINDWGWRMQVFEDGQKNVNAQPEGVFSPAYRSMLEKLKKNYPDAEIWCLTLPQSTPAQGIANDSPAGYALAQYNQAICQSAREAGCRVINMHTTIVLESNHTVDGVHPNALGMQALADAILKQI